MGKAIVITSGKGGVGKTTATANIGTALALRGRSVVVIDADIGLRNLDVVMGLESRVVYNLVDAVEGECRLQQALIKDKRLENLYLLPAAQTKNKDAVSPDQMEKLCLELKETHDYVIIDSPAGIEGGFRNAIAGADGAMVVTTPEVSAIRDADRVIGLLQAAGISELNLIINRLSPLMVKKGDMLNQNDIIEVLAIKLIGIVPEDVNVTVSTNRGRPLTLEENSQAGKAFREIAARIDGEDIQVVDPNESKTFLEKLKKFLFEERGDK